MKNVYGNRCLITGAGSGVGKACAILFAQNGFEVVGVSRSVSEGTKHYPGGGSLTLRKMDVTDESSIQHIVENNPPFDVIILSAGFGVAGACEEIPIDLAIKQMDVNYFGVMRVVQAFLPGMRAEGKGLIIGISSVAGRVSIPMQSQYSASKYAMEAFFDALRIETKGFGIRATLIEPGDMKTGFTCAREKYTVEGSDYEQMVIDSVGKMEEDEQHGIHPKIVAEAALKLCEKKNPPARVQTGMSNKLAVLAERHLSDKAVERVLTKLYMPH